MPPTVAGTNCITQSEDVLVDTIAGLAAFQAFTGTANSAAAKARIYVGDIPRTAEDQDHWTDAEIAAIYPCCIICPPPDGNEAQFRYTANSGFYDFTVNLRFLLRFERFVPASTDEQNVIRTIKNQVGDIAEDLAEAAGVGDKFAATDIMTNGVPYRSNFGRAEPQGDICGWELLLAREIQEGGQ